MLTFKQIVVVLVQCVLLAYVCVLLFAWCYEFVMDCIVRPPMFVPARDSIYGSGVQQPIPRF